ncbi:MAG: c-type cytochrome [Bdellovibrionaceae bacterium]|nr:c-type cytochrome [Bdellovibrionales bacterium]MCB9083452.1 c-type cytochrome [Pseudobdellovibrionaceae bacterium]
MQGLFKQTTVMKILVAASSLLLLSQVSHANPEGGELFKAKCAMCHNIGKGRLVGPDLAGVGEKRSEAWLLGFIKSPQSMVNKGDADAKALVAEFQMVMPNQDVTDAQIKAILAYVASEGSAGGGDTAATEETQAAPSEFTEEQIAHGRELFTGVKRFEQGGAACLSCHNVTDGESFTGGSLAVDLTGAYDRLSEAGVKGILGSIPFPAMKAAYQGRGFSDEEVTAIMAFLKDVSSKGQSEATINYGPKLFGFGVVGFIVFAIFFSLIWAGRKKESVNKELFDRQIRSR